MYRLTLPILWILATSASPVWALTPRWQQPDIIEQVFLDVALKSEYSKDPGVVRKWAEPVRVWIDHRVGDKELHQRLVTAHLTHLADITAHDVYQVDRRSRANVVVLFTNQRDWRAEVAQLIGPDAANHLHGAVCVASLSADGSGTIRQATVVIPVDQARMHGKLVACIVEELTQVLGLPNDSELAYPSIFNDRTPDDLLSGLDYLLLKILYDRRVLPGMVDSEARGVVREVIREMALSGVIPEAWERVSQGALYPMLGFNGVSESSGPVK